MFKSPDWVQALALTPAQELIMVKQFRVGSKTVCLETPGGVLEPGEDPITGAMRELQEETGFIGHDPVKLFSCYPNPALQTNKVHYILLKNCQPIGKINWDPYEDLQTELIPLSSLDNLIESGSIDHCIALAGLLYLRNYDISDLFSQKRR